jgi:hypothetical protein
LDLQSFPQRADWHGIPVTSKAHTIRTIIQHNSGSKTIFS